MIMDNFGKMYDVTALSDSFGKKYYNSIPDVISEIHISRYPINYPELSGKNNEIINDANFSSFLIIKKQIQTNIYL